MVICLERAADLHKAQLMPLPLTVSCFSKKQIGFTSLVPAHPGNPGKRAIKRVCVCVFGQENRIFLATRSVLWPKICRKCDSWGSWRRSPRPPSRLGSGHPAPLGAFDRRAPLTPNPGDASRHHHFLR